VNARAPIFFFSRPSSFLQAIINNTCLLEILARYAPTFCGILQSSHFTSVRMIVGFRMSRFVRSRNLDLSWFFLGIRNNLLIKKRRHDGAARGRRSTLKKVEVQGKK
jgi:hypothetical protein